MTSEPKQKAALLFKELMMGWSCENWRIQEQEREKKKEKEYIFAKQMKQMLCPKSSHPPHYG